MLKEIFKAIAKKMAHFIHDQNISEGNFIYLKPIFIFFKNFFYYTHKLFFLCYLNVILKIFLKSI